MNEKNFSPELLQKLKNSLLQYPKRTPLMNQLIKTFDFYHDESITSHPRILNELSAYIDGLSQTSQALAESISETAKKCCRECMFHIDDCFINIIYLIFHSIESGMKLEPARVRPALRLDIESGLIKRIANPLQDDSGVNNP